MWSNKLIAWYQVNKRNLPWREVADPYKIWVSEVILQQTRVDQGLDYYHRFVANFPDVYALAAADQDLVLKVWQGLGYYSRARNMHAAAQQVVALHNGKFPETLQGLLALKGIGPYTAAAVASICFNKPHPVIDGNVMRVVSRWFAITEAVNTGEGKQQISASLSEVFDQKNPGTFNQALMEFGATVCKPKNPECVSCIFNQNCLAYQRGLVGQLPAKVKKKPPTKRFFHYLIPVFILNGTPHTIVRKRDHTDIWAGLYDFPLIETAAELDSEMICETPEWKKLFVKQNPVLKQVSGLYLHQLTHRQIHARFLVIQGDASVFSSLTGKTIPVAHFTKLPAPRLISRFIEENPFMAELFGKNAALSSRKL